MKKLLFFVLCLLVLPNMVMATESVVVTQEHIIPRVIEQVIFTCTGAADGSITNTAFSQQVLRDIQGMYLYCVTAYPTSGGTAPDAADVFILTPGNEDLLGSDDNSTAGNGANLIHATLQKTCIPYLGLLNLNFYPVVHEVLTLQVANQDTDSADFTVVLTFVK